MEQSPNYDILGAVSGALRGDRAKAQTLVEGARQRIQLRANEALRSKFERAESPAPAAAAPGPAAAGAKLAPQPMPSMAPPRPVQLRSPDGRKLRVTLTPAPARRADLAALGQVAAKNDRLAFEAIARQERALAELSRSQRELSNKVAELQEQSDAALVGMLDRFGGFELQVATQRRALRAQAAAAEIEKVTSAVNSAQVGAFGEKGSVFATNNLLLAGNQLLWSFSGPLLRRLGIDLGGALAVLAPIGSLVTSAATLGRRQHVRFVSGVVTFNPQTIRVDVPLAGRVASAHLPELRRRTDVPATATVLDGAPPIGIRAVVRNGVLSLVLSDNVPRTFRVAWMVDTGVGNG